jgi:hypothetical protein
MIQIDDKLISEDIFLKNLYVTFLNVRESAV